MDIEVHPLFRVVTLYRYCSHNLRPQSPQSCLGNPIDLHPKWYYGFFFFLIAWTLTADTLQGWELNLLCKSANHVMRAFLDLFFHNLSFVTAKEKILFRAHLETFTLFTCIWSYSVLLLNSFWLLLLWPKMLKKKLGHCYFSINAQRFI